MLSLLLPPAQATEKDAAKDRLRPKTRQMSGELSPGFPSKTRLVWL